MSGSQHRWIDVTITAITFSAAVFGAIQYVQVTPLSMENSSLKEKLAARSSEIKSSKEYRELEAKMLYIINSEKFLKDNISELKEQLNEYKAKDKELVSLKTKLFSYEYKLNENVNLIKKQESEITKLKALSDIKSKLDALSEEQRRLENTLKNELAWKPEDSKEAKRLRARIAMLQEQINLLINKGTNI